MLNSGDVVDIDLGIPEGREAGSIRPGVVLTSQAILDASPGIVHVVPLTTTLRGFGSEVRVKPDEENGIDHPSAAQCQHIRAVATARIRSVRGNVGPANLREIREVVGLILDLPD